MLISVVVCTHNRANLLANVLETLSKQDLPSNEYEVIVVDNNSTDKTRLIVEGLTSCDFSLRYFLETNIGLSHARNRGWREAVGDYVAYIDDDCKVTSQWLMIAKEVIEKIMPAVFGGPYYAFYDKPKPTWFKDSYGSSDHGNNARALNENEYLMGGNIFFRRALLNVLDGFDIDLGMSSQKVAYGEETALQRHIRSAVPEQLIYYDPRLYVYHLVRPEKMTMRWVIRSAFPKGRDVYRVIHDKNARPSNRGSLFIKSAKIFALLGADVVWGVISRDRKKYPYMQNYFYEHTSRYLRGLGSLYAQYLQIKENMG